MPVRHVKTCRAVAELTVFGVKFWIVLVLLLIPDP